MWAIVQYLLVGGCFSKVLQTRQFSRKMGSAPRQSCEVMNREDTSQGSLHWQRHTHMPLRRTGREGLLCVNQSQLSSTSVFVSPLDKINNKDDKKKNKKWRKGWNDSKMTWRDGQKPPGKEFTIVQNRLLPRNIDYYRLIQQKRFCVWQRTMQSDSVY